MRRRSSGVAACAFVAVAVTVPVVASATDGATWESAGGNRQNTRYAASEHRISPTTAADLEVTWVLETDGEVSATPAVDADTVYVPDWGGSMWAVDRLTGEVRWRVDIGAATGVPGDKARATPAVADDLVIVGTQGNFGGGGKLIAYDKLDGEVRWVTAVDTHPAAIITQSATVFDGVAYVGVASLEELLAAFVPGYPCCSFRGSMAAIDVATGEILWKTYMISAEPGFSGNAVWGSSPAIDTKRRQVYVATGNNYSVPDDVLDCVAAAGDDAAAKAACLAADNLFDAIVALDMSTGAIRWATKALAFDAWTVDCLPFIGDGDNCPEPAGPDFDFGQAPALFATRNAAGKRIELVGVGQKSGQYWALDPTSGEVSWVTQAGPGGVAGGLQWGSAVDGKRVYTADANSGFQPYEFADGTVTVGGVWSALDAATGEILWQATPSEGFGTSGPVTAANGVIFSCSLDPLGHMYALDAATGAELWKFASGGSCLSGAAISRGMLYWGSGYTNLGPPYTTNNRLYAFGLAD